MSEEEHEEDEYEPDEDSLKRIIEKREKLKSEGQKYYIARAKK